MKSKILCFVIMTSIACLTLGQNKPVKESNTPASNIQYKLTTPVRTDNHLQQVPTNQQQPTQIRQTESSTTIRNNYEMKETKDDPKPHVQSQTNSVIIHNIKTTPEYKQVTGDTLNNVNMEKIKRDAMIVPYNNDKFGCCCEVYDDLLKVTKVIWCPTGPAECDRLKGRTVDSYHCSDKPQ